jgi:endonuclease YncB( thermonuclease family)
MNDPDPFTFFSERTSPTAIEVPVLEVFDGDAFRTKIVLSQLTDNPKDNTAIEAIIRFGFIDAPELQQRGGYEAREFLIDLIGFRKVWIDILTKMNTGKSVDHYGRVVALAYLHDPDPTSMFGNLYLTRNIEIQMLLNGWAWVLERYGPDQIYFEALEVAQRNKRGIWARDDNVHPWIFKSQQHQDRRSRWKASNTAEKCPAEGCRGSLVKRNGKFGMFYGCSNYPNCTYSRSIEKVPPVL